MEDNLSNILSGYKKEKSELIPILQHIQETYGYLPQDVMLEVSNYTGITEDQLYAVATFYTLFKFKPGGKKQIMVCRGTACHVKGAPKIMESIERLLSIKEGETTPDLEYSLETVACIGACGLAPCITVNKKVYGNLNQDKVEKIFVRETGGA